jgi:hypothetical protein
MPCPPWFLDVNLPADPTTPLDIFEFKKSAKELKIGEEGATDSTVQIDPDSSRLCG